MLNKELIRAINTGRCFVLIGAGPSCEMGYPSWDQLAHDTHEKLKHLGILSDQISYEKYLSEKKYPELFGLAERDLGGRKQLIDILKTILKPHQKVQGYIYEYLTKWPFACYLTTNYDDEIYQHLTKNNMHFEILRNRKEDFYNIRDGATNLIFKLHSDLMHSEEAVITHIDYQKYYVSDDGQYYRDKLRHVFETFTVLIIGHSFSDPDIVYVLETAKKTASPQHPIYMLTTDVTQAEESEYFEKYNIVLIGYINLDGRHTQLRRFLSTIDRFILSRKYNPSIQQHQIPDSEKVVAASSLFLYRTLQSSQKKQGVSSLLLASLPNSNEHSIITDQLLTRPPLRNLIKSKSKEVVENALDELVLDLLVAKHDSKYKLTDKGKDKLIECNSIRDIEKRQAYGQFSVKLKKEFGVLTAKQQKRCIELAEKCITTTFESRGLTVAKKVFLDQSASSNELTDIFTSITDTASELDDTLLKLSFVDAMHQFIIEPTDPQKKYLTSISQGFFLYHLLGLDPTCSKIRNDIFNNTFWLLDSNVLLPLLAVGAHNHAYGKELFRLLKESGANLFTTNNLLQEAWEHFAWADKFIKNRNIDTLEFLKAALVKGNYKQNLFIDGYILLCANGEIGTFEDYLNKVFEDDRSSFRNHLEKSGIQIIDLSKIEGFMQEDWGDIEDAKSTLSVARKQRGTYRSDLQVESEAEIKVLIEKLRSRKYVLPENPNMDKVYFISQSRILDKVFSDGAFITWVPEAVYRYLSSLPGQQTDPNLLQKCMLNEFYYAGVSFIDKESYLRFFGTTVDASKLSYDNEKSRYIESVESAHVAPLDDGFNATPDLEKPFFVAHMAWKLNNELQQREDIIYQRAIEAESKVKKLEAEKEIAWKKREKVKQKQESARLRHLKDPKHLQKRLKQAKKRRKKKKK